MKKLKDNLGNEYEIEYINPGSLYKSFYEVYSILPSGERKELFSIDFYMDGKEIDIYDTLVRYLLKNNISQDGYYIYFKEPDNIKGLLNITLCTPTILPVKYISINHKYFGLIYDNMIHKVIPYSDCLKLDLGFLFSDIGCSYGKFSTIVDSLEEVDQFIKNSYEESIAYYEEKRARHLVEVVNCNELIDKIKELKNKVNE